MKKKKKNAWKYYYQRQEKHRQEIEKLKDTIIKLEREEALEKGDKRKKPRQRSPTENRASIWISLAPKKLPDDLNLEGQGQNPKLEIGSKEFWERLALKLKQQEVQSLWKKLALKSDFNRGKRKKNLLFDKSD